MAEKHRRRRIKSDDDSEGSFSESDGEADTNDAENSLKETPEKFSKRRRRRVLSVDGWEDHSVSETDSDQEDDVHIVKNRRKAVSSKAADVSEYESAEEEEEDDKTPDKIHEDSISRDRESLSELVDEEGGEEGIAETEDVEGDFLTGEPAEEVSEEGDYVEEERQQGDGEECSPSNLIVEKELDFDEDRRNPQYIPKKGIFYEHDDRNNEDIKEKEEDHPRDRKKKLWLDEGKWGHDRFREEEQYPKSRHELIEIYGYDIRNEDGPPRARRRRRYGRGPTKYDRNWEDVTAYGKERFRSSSRGFSRGRRTRGRFRGAPRFRGQVRRQYNSQNLDKYSQEIASQNNEVPENEICCTDICAKDAVPVINNKEFPALPSSEKEQEIEKKYEKTYFPKDFETVESKSVRTLTFENSNLSTKNSSECEAPSRRVKTTPFNSTHDRGSRRPAVRGSRGSGRSDHNRRGRSNIRHVSPRFLENRVNNLNSELESLSLGETSEVCNGGNSEFHRQSESHGNMASHTNDSEISNMALKGGGDSSGRPKRYSSLRQRSLPETTSYQTTQQPVPPPHPTYYETGYQTTLYASSETAANTQSQSATSPPVINPSAYQTFAATPYTDNYGLRMPVTTPPPRLFPQANVPAAQPLLAPPPCITPSPNILNFAAAPPPTSYQFTYQQFAAPPAPPPTAPGNDLFQPGITYYYPPSQQTGVRPSIQKRPKAAIPILPPPEHEVKRNDKKDTCESSKRNFQENSLEDISVEITSLRTESSSQLQASVGVES